MVKPRGLSKAADLLLKVALAALSPLLVLALLEGLAYGWERSQANGPFAWELVASRRLAWEQHGQLDAGYTLMTPLRHYEWQGIPVDINSHGLRGPETSYDKPPGTYRILNLGDSVVMGWGVREEDTYGRRLERLLNDGSSGELRYEVIAAGVPGWNLENALAYLETEGFRYQPDRILLGITIANDIKGRTALLADAYPSAIRWLRNNTYFWPFLTVQLRWLQARALGQARIDVIDPPTDPEKYFPLDPTADRWNDAWHAVLGIQHLAEQHQVDVGLVLFPLEFQVLDEHYPTVAQDVLAARAEQAGIPVVDLLPAFRAACQAKPGGACQREDRYLYADVWMHPSAYGHAVATDELLASLLDTP